MTSVPSVNADDGRLSCSQEASSSHDLFDAAPADANGVCRTTSARSRRSSRRAKKHQASQAQVFQQGVASAIDLPCGIIIAYLFLTELLE